MPSRSNGGDEDVGGKRAPAAPGLVDPGERPGATIGRYVVVSRLGEGSMGMVYLAYDPELDRRVALKVLRRRVRSSRAGRERQARLRREAMAMAQLSHANVVTVHDVGVADGRVFLAMDYVEGQTLREWLDAKRRPWNQVLRTLVYAGQGLAAAHAAGVIHRDFKPENVLVGNDGSVKVMDFGLARPRLGPENTSGITDVDGADAKPAAAPGPAEAASPPATPPEESHGDDEARAEWWKDGAVDLTRSGEVLGTPSYMAPELFDGAEANAHTDQFSFCVALWEALYGVRPFAGETMAALAFNTKRGRITPPPRRAGVPAWLGRIVRRGLSTAPDRRWPSMPGLLDALVQGAGRRRVQRAGLVAVALVALGGGLSYALLPATEPCRGGRARMREVWNDERAAAITAAFEATGVAYAGEALVRARQRLDDYAEAWVGAYTEVCQATAVHARQSPEELDHRIACLDARLQELDALLGVLGEADKRVAERAAQAASALRSPTTCVDETPHAADDADPERKAEHQDLRARMLRAEALERAGRYDDAATLAREIAAEAELHGHTELHAEALVQLGVAEDLAGSYASATEHLRQAYFVANAHGLDLVSAKAAVALVNVEGVHMAHAEEGLAWARHAEVALQRGAPGSRLRGRYHAALGSLHLQRFELAQARAHYEQALAIERAALGDDNERVAFLLTYLGAVLEQSGQSEDAVANFEQAIEIHRRALGPHHPELAGLYNNYAVVLFGRQDWAGAQAQLEQAVAIQREALGEHPHTALSIDNLGGILTLRGKLEEGRALIEEALAMREKTLGPEHPATAQSLANLAGAFELDEDWGGARRLYQRALAIVEKAGESSSQQVAVLVFGLGMLDLREGAAQRGHDHCKRAVEIYEKEGGPQAPGLPEPLMCLGWAQLELEEPRAALASLERALAIRDDGQADYGPLVRLLLARALTTTGGDAQRAARLRAEARKLYRKLPQSPPERVAAWMRDPG